MITMNRSKCKQYLEHQIENNFDQFDLRVEHAQHNDSWDTLVGKTKDNRPIWLKIVNRKRLAQLGFTIMGGVYIYAVFQSPDKTFVFNITKEVA